MINETCKTEYNHILNSIDETDTRTKSFLFNHAWTIAIAETIKEAYYVVENYNGTSEADFLYKQLLKRIGLEDKDVLDTCSRCGKIKMFVETICDHCDITIRTELNEDNNQ